jgi:prevent-host-death family protein
VAHVLDVAEAKRRFSELIDRVRDGERFVLTRRGRPAVALMPPADLVAQEGRGPLGLAALAGALADWDNLQEAVDEIYASRRRARDRDVPEVA